MKRTILLLSLLAVCAVVAVTIPYSLKAREAARRHEAYARMLAGSPPLVLDAKTTAILDGADRVETFRLQGGDEDEDVSERAALAKA